MDLVNYNYNNAGRMGGWKRDLKWIEFRVSAVINNGIRLDGL